MAISLEDFARTAQLNAAEVRALRRISTDRGRMTLARNIAERIFFAPQQDWTPDIPESAALSEAWFGAAWLSMDASREQYRRKNIAASVWLDSMTDLRIWLRNELRNSGTIGLGPLARPWQVLLYRGDVTRHGRLECNSEFFYGHKALCGKNGQEILAPGDAVINLHIPEDGPMDLAACGASMRRMADFFAVWKPQYDWKGFLCESWLLDRQLRPLLPKSSNILKFQNLGPHYRMHETDDTFFRIFGYADPGALPESTSLQRGAAEFLRRGGKFMEEGMFISRQAVEAADFDLAKMVAEHDGESLSTP